VRSLSEVEDFMRMAERSVEDLEKVKGISDRMFWSSLYYAVFYAAKAALLSLGFEPKTHKGTDRLVGQILFKDEGLIGKDEAKLFSRLRTVREEIDYNPSSEVNLDGREMKARAKEFIGVMKEIVERES